MVFLTHTMFALIDQEYLQKEVLPKFKNACQQALEEERFFGTSNHYFDSKFREDEICPKELIDSFMAKTKVLWDDSIKTPQCPNDASHRVLNTTALEQCLLDAKKEVAEEQVHTDLMETQKKRVFAAVKAHFDVEKKTFVDNLLKKTKEILIQGHISWIKFHFLRSKTIEEAAKEDKNTCKLRKDLLARMERLNECMALLRDVPLPDSTTSTRNSDEATAVSDSAEEESSASSHTEG